jgi:phosphatidylglycerophosphate synthase
MFDRHLLGLTKPVVDAAARLALRYEIKPDQITLTGFGLGLLSALVIAIGFPAWALIFLIASRLCDGLDGAVARLSSSQTHRGAFLDIALDFIFYASIPLGFAIRNPTHNALPAAVLLFAFVGTGTSFLAYAIMAEKQGLKSTAYPTKSIYYLGGLTEGAETLAAFVAMCLWPEWFPLIAYVYAALCAVTTAMRIYAGWETFGSTAR